MSTSKVTISLAKIENASDIRDIIKTSWITTFPNDDYGITKEDLIANFSDSPSKAKSKTEEWQNTISDTKTRHVWIAREDNKVIGFCLARKSEYKNIIQAIHVLPEYHRRGIGSKLMQKAISWLGDGKDIQLKVNVYNIQAQKFYEQVGFRKTGKTLDSKVAMLPSGKSIPQIEMVRPQG